MEKARSTYSTWEVVPLGQYQTQSDYLTALAEARIWPAFHVWNNSKSGLLNKSQVVLPAKKEKYVHLVRTNLVDMGLPTETIGSYEEICKRGEELGLRLCRPEVAFALRLLRPCQDNDEEWYIIGKPMNPPCEWSYSKRVIFTLQRRANRQYRTTAAPHDYRTVDLCDPEHVYRTCAKNKYVRGGLVFEID